MLTQSRRSPFAGRAFVAFSVCVMLAASACDKVPLLAPTGTVITLFPAATTIPLNGETEIVATVIENGVAQAPSTGTGNGGTGTGNGGTTTPTTGTTSTPGAGTPVQNGTLVSFTTTIGRIEPVEARTSNGQVHVRFIAGGQSGTATITAFSGGASGKIENLKVGTAAVERVLLTATPQTLGASGGVSQVSARVEDVSGLAIVGVPVTFTADTGTLSAATATTDQNGVATVSLNTSAKATVTANVAGKTATVTVNLNPRTGISITPPTNQVSAGQSAVFTVNVNSAANIRNVVVSWGDGTTTPLGAISASTPVQHTYDEPGTYTVTATATDASGFTEPASTSVRILPAQPPSITINAPSSATINQSVRITATVSGNTSSIVRYEWTFDACAEPPALSTTSNVVNVRWTCAGTKIITVRAIQATGPQGDNSQSITIVP
jgi:Big-like domain-containing protein/PKD domain-containing protein